MKYSVIMPYNNKPSLYNTLLSYRHHYEYTGDYEVLVMEDHKNRENSYTRNTLLNILLNFPDVNARIIRTDFVDCFAPSRMFNEGVIEAEGKFIVLTNPECFHQTSVLAGFDVELHKDPNAYIVAACYNTDDVKIVKKFSDFKPKRKIWLQHSKQINRGLHWCSAMSKTQFNKVGGFDEGYSAGFGREDVDFVRMVKAKGIKVIAKDDIIVVHQNHPDIPRKKELWNRNKRYYDKKWGIK